MSRRNIYQGPTSCWAQYERVSAPGSGIDERAARAILYLMEAELRRGWTYDHFCRRIKMTPELAKKRAVYLIALAKKHRGVAEARRVAEIVYDWLERRGLLPKSARRKVATYVSA
ncbi:MAG: hypothetical protein ACO2PN_24925 [Pyrobaculum sp.]|jgi:hypothetical protein